jgi:hypothetical protein
VFPFNKICGTEIQNKSAIIEDNMLVGNEKLVRITCAGFQMFLEVGQGFQSSM